MLKSGLFGEGFTSKIIIGFRHKMAAYLKSHVIGRKHYISSSFLNTSSKYRSFSTAKSPFQSNYKPILGNGSLKYSASNKANGLSVQLLTMRIGSFERQQRSNSTNTKSNTNGDSKDEEKSGKESNKRVNLVFWIPVGGIILLGGTLLYSFFFQKEDNDSKKKSWLKSLPLPIRVRFFLFIIILFQIALFGAIVTFFAGFNGLFVPFLVPGILLLLLPVALLIVFFKAMKRYGGIPFLPSLPERVESLFHLIPLKKLQGQQLVDLGSGDGRIVVEAARYNKVS